MPQQDLPTQRIGRLKGGRIKEQTVSGDIYTIEDLLQSLTTKGEPTGKDVLQLLPVVATNIRNRRVQETLNALEKDLSGVSAALGVDQVSRLYRTAQERARADLARRGVTESGELQRALAGVGTNAALDTLNVQEAARSGELARRASLIQDLNSITSDELNAILGREQTLTGQQRVISAGPVGSEDFLLGTSVLGGSQPNYNTAVTVQPNSSAANYRLSGGSYYGNSSFGGGSLYTDPYGSGNVGDEFGTTFRPTSNRRL